MTITLHRLDSIASSQQILFDTGPFKAEILPDVPALDSPGPSTHGSRLSDGKFSGAVALIR